MTGHPLGHLLTVAEYAALGEREQGYVELFEGRLLVSPDPAPEHNVASGELFVELRAQVPDHLMVIQSVDVDLELAPAGQPGFSRRPDLIVVRRAESRRVRAEGGLIRASEVLVAVEIVMPGPRRMETVEKRGEYADAGIPHYWIVDLVEPVSLLACHLAGEFGYQDAPAVIGEFSVIEPFPVKIDVSRLG